MKYVLSISFILSTSFLSHAQTPDTIYVDQIDTVLINEPPVIVNTVFYEEEYSEKKLKNNFAVTSSIGATTDFIHYEYCKNCETNFNKLKSSYSNANSFQLGGQLSYIYKKISFGIDVSYRRSSRKISYDSDTLTFKSVISVKYLMVGPAISYRILRKNKWDIDIGMGVLFSHTLHQKGKTIGGEQINTLIDVETKKLISEKNILYHVAPSVGFNLTPSLSFLLIAHYYFDIDSNIEKGQSYTEQRNTVGLSFGIKHSL